MQFFKKKIQQFFKKKIQDVGKSWVQTSLINDFW